MFNPYLWKIYREGKGSRTIRRFQEILFGEYTGQYGHFIAGLHRAFCPSESVTKDIEDELLCVYKDQGKNIYFFERKQHTVESAVSSLYRLYMEVFDQSPKVSFEEFSNSIEYYTTYFARELGDLLVPYYFKHTYIVFEKIAQEFDIPLPTLPAKKDYEGRFLFYGKICQALQKFRLENGLDPAELCAFLYDFAPKYIGGTASYIVDDLPKAEGAYFIGSSKDDIYYTTDPEAITPWQCNPETEVGDNIVMYLTSPTSAIDSIWRSASVGFNDPFFYYYRCTYISHPVKIKNIPLSQMREDKILGNLPIVRKNMQGINGVEILPSAYNRILDLSNEDLERIEYTPYESHEGISREKDVETQLIKPFLAELGYSEADYIKQLYIRVGNDNHLLIPDFVINPVTSLGHQKADFVIEAKFTLVSRKAIEAAKIQARSYAKILSAKYAVLSSKEGIWIMDAGDDYSQCILQFSWEELKNEDNFYQVYSILGKNKIGGRTV
ncbi:hypothetical protein [Kallipyga massiliensis]|uniref:hypothetical protein n=1 Tax=Kallipyga massiliensis TaxID=1472764 RepID=UPI0004BB9EC0|nr:hypothetical protein [Kallipyga massiliensis]